MRLEDIQFEGCPVPADLAGVSADHKIAFQVGLDEREVDRAIEVVVTVDGSLPPLPECPDGKTTCANRDEFILARDAVAREAFDCIGSYASQFGSIRDWWFEEPAVLDNGEFRAALLGFQTRILASNLSMLARHPFVTGITRPPYLSEPVQCPMPSTDDPYGKVDGEDGDGTFQTVVELEMPAPCEACAEDFLRPHAYVVGRRDLTCVFQAIVTAGGKYDRFEVSGIEIRDGLVAFVSSVVGPLTHAQALEVARYPQVASVHMTDWAPQEDIVFMDDLHEGPCPEANDSIEGKIDQYIEQKIGQGRGGSLQVDLTILGGADLRRGAVPCPGGPQGSCPEREAAFAAIAVAQLESQRCVRELLTALGAVADLTNEGSSAISNTIPTYLNWEQVQKVAAHPHVLGVWDANPPLVSPP